MNQKERIIELVRHNVITMEEALALLEAGNQSTEQATEPKKTEVNENITVDTAKKAEEVEKQVEQEEQTETSTREETDTSQAETKKDVEDDPMQEFSQQLREIADGAVEMGRGTFNQIRNYIRQVNEETQAKHETIDKEFDVDEHDFSEEYRQDQEAFEAEFADYREQHTKDNDDVDSENKVEELSEDDIAKMTEEINQLSAEMDQANESIKKKREALTIAQQRLREIEIFAELDEVTEDMQVQQQHLNLRISELEKEIAELEKQLEESKEELNSINQKQTTYNRREFKRFVDQTTDQVSDVASKISSDAIKEGRKIGDSFTSKMKDLMQNFNSKEFNVSVNVPWVKTEKLEHKFVYEAAEVSVLDFVLNNGSLKFKAHEENQILIDSTIRFHGKHEDISVAAFEEMNTISVDDHQLVFHVNSAKVSMDATVYLPHREYDYLKIALINGDLGIKDLDINDVLISNKNGDVRIKNTSAVMVEIDSLNGDVTFKETDIKDISLKNLNGDFKIVGKVGNIISNTVNGDYYITKQDLNDSVLKLKGVNGDAKISFDKTLNLEVESSVMFGKIHKRLTDVEVITESKEKNQAHYSRLVDPENGRVKIDVRMTTGDVYLKDSENIENDVK